MVVPLVIMKFCALERGLNYEKRAKNSTMYFVNLFGVVQTSDCDVFTGNVNPRSKTVPGSQSSRGLQDGMYVWPYSRHLQLPNFSLVPTSRDSQSHHVDPSYVSIGPHFLGVCWWFSSACIACRQHAAGEGHDLLRMPFFAMSDAVRSAFSCVGSTPSRKWWCTKEKIRPADGVLKLTETHVG